MEAKETKQENTKRAGKVLHGVVVSNKAKDTAVVEVSRYTKHPKYKKFIKHSKRYLAHDAGNTKEVGEQVSIQETKPYSKNKTFVVVEENRS